MRIHRDPVSGPPTCTANNHEAINNNSKKRKRELEIHDKSTIEIHGHSGRIPKHSADLARSARLIGGDNEENSQYEGSNDTEDHQQWEGKSQYKESEQYEENNHSDIDQSDQDDETEPSNPCKGNDQISTPSEPDELDECNRNRDFNDDDGAESSSGKYYRWVAHRP
jgi:hypothetical protein